MAGIQEDRERQVVPLWRKFETTASRGELTSLIPANKARFNDEMLTELQKDWEATQSFSVAADFVSVALALGRFSVARDAAHVILAVASAPEPAKRVAVCYLAEGTAGVSEEQPVPVSHFAKPRKPGITRFEEQLYTGVSTTRQQLIAYPRNPILWVNLAHLYTSLGVTTKAEQAICNALSLAPENRFVLRAASRYYLHQGRRDLAHHILTDTRVVQADPWILSAEIATAAAIGRTSKNIKLARRLVDAQRHTPFHLSELASALGTLESRNGNLKAARPLVAFSLRQPAENSIAQAAWLRRNIGGVGDEKEVTPSYEANAWYAWRSANWTHSLAEAKLWQAEQPFSSRPAALGAHLASVLLEDYQQGINLAKQGLLSKPNDFSLRNVLAFSLAKGGDATEAEKVFSRVDESQLNDRQRVVWMATRGLIAFRAGAVAEGRLLYRAAINLGKQTEDVRLEPVARLYYAVEELRLGSANAEELRKEALAGSSALTEPSLLSVVEKVRKYGKS